MSFLGKCALTRYLDGISNSERSGGKDEIAATMLSFLGYFSSPQKPPDYRSLQGVVDMLVDQGREHCLEEMSKHCIGCTAQTNCLVENIVLNGQRRAE